MLLFGLGELVGVEEHLPRDLVVEDVLAQLDALVTDVHRRTRDELRHLVLTSSAERTAQYVWIADLLFHEIAYFFSLGGR
jgi:hypothetical protein